MKAHFCDRMFVVVAGKGDVAIYPVAVCQKIQTIICHSVPRPHLLIVGTMSRQVMRDKNVVMYETVHILSMKLMS